ALVANASSMVSPWKHAPLSPIGHCRTAAPPDNGRTRQESPRPDRGAATMSNSQATLDQQAEAYERHLRENWDRLPAWEQEQAQRYFAWKNANPGQLTDPHPVSPPRGADDGLGWAVKGGYLCAVAAFLLSPLIFAPIGIVLGIYNITRGRYG